MPRYIDADMLKKFLHEEDFETPDERWRPESEFAKMIDACQTVDAVEVVRCSDCAVPHNKWTGCPNLNGMIPPPDFYCARGERKQEAADAADNDFSYKPSCRVCERITDANKEIFWTFARTHQFEHKEEFVQVPARFCPACGREIEKEKA